jgi:hypothetical protein
MKCDGKFACHECYNVLTLARAAAIQFLMEPTENLDRMRMMCHSIKDLCDQIHPQEELSQQNDGGD